MTTAVWMRSTGSASNANYSRSPTYQTIGNVSVQNQALAASDLRHLDALNIETVTRKVWVSADLQGVNRSSGQGGDLLVFGGRTWLVTIVFETWDNDGPWSSVGLTLQMNGP